VNTERLAERETLLHSLGSKLNRTGAAADEYNLNVVDCNRDASVTVARPTVLNLSQLGSGGVPPAL